MSENKEIYYKFQPSLINEYMYCKKLFWLHYNKIRLFEEDKNIKIGKSEHEKNEGESENIWIRYDQKKGSTLIEYTKRKKIFQEKDFSYLYI